MPSPASADSAALQSGDIVLLDYEVWAEGGDHADLVDTTRESAAQKASHPLPEGTSLEPRPHLVGGDYFPPGIEQALVGAKIGTAIAREFAPSEAFGERDPKLIELFSMHEISRLPEMRRDDADLQVGTILTIKGRRGRVVTLTAARVRVDFNPPLAGRKIRAEFTPIRRVEGTVDQARAIIDLTYGHGRDFEVKSHQGLLSIRVPERTKFDLGWMATKPKLIDRLRSHLHPKSIEITEEYVTPSPKSGPSEDSPKGAAPPSPAASPEAAGGTSPAAPSA